MNRMNAEDARRFLAEEIRVVHNIQSARIIEAIATVPRNRFLPPGPWLIRGTEVVASFLSGSPGQPRYTDDADPCHVHHDIVVAIDSTRDLYNGQPSLVATWLDQLKLCEGSRVIHIGTGTGYFTALIGYVVGPTGMVHGIEIDSGLAAAARANLASLPWVTVHDGNGSSGLPSAMDAVLVHAGTTHIIEPWLDALSDGGRLLVPLTVAMPGLSSTLSKGVVLMITREATHWSARFTSPVVIYSLQGIRDETRAPALAKAMMSGRFAKVTQLRRDKHDLSATCWLHSDLNCISE